MVARGVISEDQLQDMYRKEKESGETSNAHESKYDEEIDTFDSDPDDLGDRDNNSDNHDDDDDDDDDDR